MQLLVRLERYSMDIYKPYTPVLNTMTEQEIQVNLPATTTSGPAVVQATTTANTLPAVKHVDQLGLMERAELYYKSKLFRDLKGAAQALVKIVAGNELGLGEIASLNGIYIVEDKVTLSANVMGTIIKRSKKYNFTVPILTNEECQIKLTEYGPKGRVVSEHTISFTMKDAERADLLSKAGKSWKRYPKNMLYCRALSNAAKWHCQDLFAGNTPYTPDEIDTSIEIGEDMEPVILAHPSLAEQRSMPNWSDSQLYSEVVELCKETNTPEDNVANAYNFANLNELDDDGLATAKRQLIIKKKSLQK